MKFLEARLALISAGLLTAFLGFGSLALVNFYDHQSLMRDFQVSTEVLTKSQLLFKSGNHSQQRQDLEKLSGDLRPAFRGGALDRILKYPSRQNLVYLVDSETRYQNYLLDTATRLSRRVQKYSALSLIFTTFLCLFYFFMNRKWVFKPLQKLNHRMLDFLNNRYSYEFEAPADTELGRLENTFNLMAQRVLDQIEALQSLDRAKSEFLSIASHELRTPLTSIKGSLSLMRAGVSGKVNDSSKNLMGIALTETDRLIRLINDLLDLAKIEAGGFSLNTEWSNVEDLLHSTAKGIEGFATTAKVKIKVVCEHPIEAFMDRDRTQQVLTNLASNAIKYSPEDGTVTLSALTDDNNQLRFEVKDQGKGIAPQDQELIFEKFRQVTGPENPLVKGTGLGLAISKGLIEEQGGTIHVTSSPGQGSTFYFYLPKWRMLKPKNEVSAS